MDEKKDNILPYYNGLKSYCNFLLAQFQNLQSNEILQRENINASLVGFISLILLSIKEELVEKKENLEFDSKIFLKELEKSVEYISKKVPNGYEIDNYIFENASSLVATIRNKIAHGDYTLDLSHGKLNIYIENQQISISIQKLSTFIATSLMNYYNNQLSSEKTITFVENDKVLSTRKKPLKSKAEIKNAINNFKIRKITLKRKNKEPIPKNILLKTKEIIEIYKRTRNLKVLIDYQKLIKDEYEFTWEHDKLPNDKIEELVDSLSVWDTVDIDYEREMTCIGERIMKIYYENKKNNEIGSAFQNIVLLTAIMHTKSTDSKTLTAYITSNYANQLTIDCTNIGITSIAMFEAIFGYPNDDIYPNPNEFTSKENTGFPYDLLNLSKFKIGKYTIDTGNLTSLNEEEKAKSKQISELKNRILSKQTSLEIVTKKNNQSAIQALSQGINQDNNLMSNLQIKLLSVSEEIQTINTYLANNLTYTINKSVINGIRNSISHGTYTITETGTIDNSKIIFEDIYNGELTFKAEIKLLDFLLFLEKSEPIVLEFLSKSTPKKKSI